MKPLYRIASVFALSLTTLTIPRSALAEGKSASTTNGGEVLASPPPPTSSPESRAARAETPKAEPKGEEGPEPSGFSLGARLGYALPMGSIAKDSSLGGATDLSKTAAGMVPLWADIGYRINPHWWVGGYFQLGIVSTAGDLCKRLANGSACSSSGTDIRFGGQVRYTFKPEAKFAPWIGVSSGYEIVNVGVTVGQASADMSAKGWEFVGFHLGADFHPMPALSMGPVVMASFGQYASQSWSQPNSSGSSDFTNTALHQWVFLGFRGQYDL